jgi:hypothetical protein
LTKNNSLTKNQEAKMNSKGKVKVGIIGSRFEAEIHAE